MPKVNVESPDEPGKCFLGVYFNIYLFKQVIPVMTFPLVRTATYPRLQVTVFCKTIEK